MKEDNIQEAVSLLEERKQIRLFLNTLWDGYYIITYGSYVTTISRHTTDIRLVVEMELKAIEARLKEIGIED